MTRILSALILLLFMSTASGEEKTFDLGGGLTLLLEEKAFISSEWYVEHCPNTESICRINGRIKGVRALKRIKGVRALKDCLPLRYGFFLERDVRNLLVIFALFIVSACSNKAVNDNIMLNKRSSCERLPPSQYDECMEGTDKSYDEYERDRREIDDG